MANELFQVIKREAKNYAKYAQLNPLDLENKYFSLDFYLKNHNVMKSPKFWEIYVIECVDNENSIKNQDSISQSSTLTDENDTKRYSLINLLMKYFSEIYSLIRDKEIEGIVQQNVSRHYLLREDETKLLNVFCL